ncbi:hypothetical protein TNCV_2827201 [Trichonephila clavipes]|nr:hypothetical protein TNCV_2827201 [Trichonephila clavipes]
MESIPKQVVLYPRRPPELYARRPVGCALLTASIRKDWILCSCKHQLWTPQEWGHVLFSDDSKCTRLSDSHRVYLKRT